MKSWVYVKSEYRTKKGSGDQLEIILEQWNRKGFGLWAVFNRENSIFMGECGLRELRLKSDEIELSYGLIPSFWGSGYASEASMAIIEYGFSNLGLGKIHGISNVNNKASLHVLKKLGFIIGQAMNDEDDKVVRCILSQDQWIETRGGKPREYRFVNASQHPPMSG